MSTATATSTVPPSADVEEVGVVAGVSFLSPVFFGGSAEITKTAAQRKEDKVIPPRAIQRIGDRGLLIEVTMFKGVSCLKL